MTASTHEETTKGDAIMFDLKRGKIAVHLMRFGVLAAFAVAAGAVYSQAVAPTNSYMRVSVVIPLAITEAMALNRKQ